MKEELQYIFGNVNHWLSFAEAKNAALIGFNSAVVIGLLAMLKDIKNDAIIFGLSYFLIPLFIFGALISLISLMPILKYFKSNQNKSDDNNDDNSNIHYFGTLKDLTIDELLTKLNTSQSTGNNDISSTRFEKDLASQIIMNSKITWEKYRFFNVASSVTLIGFILSLLSLFFYTI